MNKLALRSYYSFKAKQPKADPRTAYFAGIDFMLNILLGIAHDKTKSGKDLTALLNELLLDNEYNKLISRSTK